MRTRWCHLSHFTGTLRISQAHLDCMTVSFKVTVGVFFAVSEFEKWEPAGVNLETEGKDTGLSSIENLFQTPSQPRVG